MFLATVIQKKLVYFQFRTHQRAVMLVRSLPMKSKNGSTHGRAAFKRRFWPGNRTRNRVKMLLCIYKKKSIPKNRGRDACSVRFPFKTKYFLKRHGVWRFLSEGFCVHQSIVSMKCIPSLIGLLASKNSHWNTYIWSLSAPNPERHVCICEQ